SGNVSSHWRDRASLYDDGPTSQVVCFLFRTSPNRAVPRPLIVLDLTIDVPVGNSNAISEAVARALGKAMPPPSPDFPQVHAAELFTKERREPIYRTLGLAPPQVQQIEDMVSNAPARKPGKGALNNLVSRVQSLK